MNEEVYSTNLAFFNKGVFDDHINFTHIILIPKVKNHVKPSDFRSIILCYVIYKLVSKVLTNKLKMILPIIIYKNQSAFILKRLISNNIIVAFETLHSMKTRQKGKGGSMARKLEISKAYDYIEWSFLEGMMRRKMSIQEKWIMMIMICIFTMTDSILINW